MECFKHFVGDSWSNENDVAKDFADNSVLDFNIFIAAYYQGSYEGSAYVLAGKDGILYEVEASHCSCYGLEESWKPTVVTVEYLKNRLEKGRFDGDEITNLVRQFVDMQQ
jgi:hypothetical protein